MSGDSSSFWTGSAAGCAVKSGAIFPDGFFGRLPPPCQVHSSRPGRRDEARGETSGIAARGVPYHRAGMAVFSDSVTTLAEMKSRVLAFARDRDWEQFHAPKNLSMALAAEAAELMEHFLWAAPEASREIANQPAKRAKIEEELADVIIYALEFANMTGIDVAAAVERKMEANAMKYPVEKARGRPDKYTDL